MICKKKNSHGCCCLAVVLAGHPALPGAMAIGGEGRLGVPRKKQNPQSRGANCGFTPQSCLFAVAGPRFAEADPRFGSVWKQDAW